MSIHRPIFERVLFVGAHVDDIELFAGGLLCATADRAMTLTFSCHGSVLEADRVAMAEQEHLSNMVLAGVPADRVVLHGLNACDGSFQSERDFIYQQILSAVRAFGPTLVVTHQPNDTNQDHQQVFGEVVRSCKGLTSIIGGEYPFNHVEGPVPTLFAELNPSHMELKARMIANYRSQQMPGRHYFDASVWMSLAKVRGAQIGKPLAEAFHVVRIVM
jgi:N-acetylglucosamine malate deacetylase 1